MKQYASKRKEALMYYPSIWGYDLPAIVIAVSNVNWNWSSIMENFSASFLFYFS